MGVASRKAYPHPGPRRIPTKRGKRSSLDVDLDVDLDLDVVLNAVVVAVVSIDGRLLANQAGQHRNNSFKNLSGIFERGFI